MNSLRLNYGSDLLASGIWPGQDLQGYTLDTYDFLIGWPETFK